MNKAQREDDRRHHREKRQRLYKSRRHTGRGGSPIIVERKGRGYTNQAGAEADGSPTTTRRKSRGYTNQAYTEGGRIADDNEEGKAEAIQIKKAPRGEDLRQ